MRKYVGQYIGRPTPAYDALQKVTGELPYTDDLFFPDLLWGKVLTSPHAHARILSIDTSAAEALEGVRAVITYDDVPQTLYNRIMRSAKDELPRTERVLDREVRFVGDKVAAVAADTESIAIHAASLIRVEYEVLPAVFDQEEALQQGAPLVYPENPDGNLLKDQLSECGDVDAALSSAEVIVENSLSTAMLHHGAIEPHQCIGRWSRGDELEIWEPQQGVHRVQIMLGLIFDLPYTKIRVHGINMGGTFGGKDGVLLEPLTLLLSKKAGGAPVKIRFNRTESIVSTYTRHAVKLYGKMALTRDGLITGFSIDSYMNAGPHCGGSINVQAAMCGKMFKVYHVPSMRFHGRAVYTNTPVGGAMRGFGSPKIFGELELLINKAAKELGMDPVELRRKNLIEPFMNDPSDKSSLGAARVKECLISGAESFRWEERTSTCRRLSDARYAYGCGVAAAMHGNGVSPFAPDITVAELMLHEDGSVLLRTGLTDHGSGTYTLEKQIVAETLQIPFSQIEFTHSDTHSCPYDMGSGASRNTWSGGSAVWAVCRQMAERMKSIAAEMMGCGAAAITMKDGLFFDDTGKSASRGDIACYAYSVRRERLLETVSYNSEHNAGSYGAHFAMVRVDRTNGNVKVLEYLAMCDIGTPLNPLLLTGQIEGAIVMGLGMALLEELRLSENGAPINKNFKKYKLPHACDIPRITVEFVDNYEQGGPYGGKSVGESSIVPVMPAIVGAVNSALNTDLHELPLTPARILAALQP